MTEPTPEEAFVLGWIAGIRRGNPYYDEDPLTRRTARTVYRTKVSHEE